MVINLIENYSLKVYLSFQLLAILHTSLVDLLIFGRNKLLIVHFIIN